MQIFQMRVSGQDFNLFVIDCSQISCGKSLKVGGGICDNCVCVQMHYNVYTKKRGKNKNAVIAWCSAQICVCVCVLARAVHFKEFLMTVKKWKDPAVKNKDRYWGREMFLLAVTKDGESRNLSQSSCGSGTTFERSVTNATSASETIVRESNLLVRKCCSVQSVARQYLVVFSGSK